MAQDMQTEEDDSGGPAFPVVAEFDVFSPGMTLRDYFAGQALAGFLSSFEGRRFNARAASEDGTGLTEFNASLAYEYADAMIKARGTTS